MTAVQARPAPSPTPPSPTRGPSARARNRKAAGRARSLSRVGLAAAGVGWRIAAVAVRYPKTSAALAGASVVMTPVTVRHVTGAVVAGCAAIGSAYWSGREQRQSLAILHSTAKFRKRKTRIQRRWVTVMTDAGLVKSPIEGGLSKRKPKVRRIAPTPLGVSVTVDAGRVSAGAADFRAKADRLRAGFRCRDVKVTDLGGGMVLLDFRFEDPFRRTIRARELPRSTRPLHATTGLDEDGHPLEKDLRLPNLWVGAQGAGKSSEVWTLLYGLQQSGVPHRVRVFDPKGGQEFSDLEDAAYYYERNPTRWAQFLEHAHRAMACRQAALRARRLRENQFTDEFPLDVMLIDELLTALAMSKGATKVTVEGSKIPASDAFMVYLSTCRAAGFTVVACSQLSQKSSIGDIRDLFPYVTVLRVTSDEIVNTILGPGAAKAYPAHEIPAGRRTAGIGYMATDAGVVKYRAAYLHELERKQVVARMRAATERFRSRDLVEVA